ncbi:MAG TPA: hypothetical protein DEW09_12875 [Pseudomonas sp.]|nr:hypothetical protein [Pseudomonas sp.]
MDYYCININKDEHGDNEVHRETCDWAPSERTELGRHENCASAVKFAKGVGFKDANGCIHCCRECHTS